MSIYIGVHAAVTGMVLLTREATRNRTCFPTLDMWPRIPDSMMMSARVWLSRRASLLAGSVVVTVSAFACHPARSEAPNTPGIEAAESGATGDAIQTAAVAAGDGAPAQGMQVTSDRPIQASIPGGQTTFWEGADLSPKPPIVALSAAEEQKRFQLQPGYRIEPVLTEPGIEQPAAIAFDANGRMYVLELRSYMLTADAKDELAPINRISRWEDRDDDGVYESHTVFVDGLVFPRFVTPLEDGVILTKESNADEVWKYSDTDGDGVADRKELFTTGFGRQANVEHQESHLTWALDNWMYATYNSIRLRWTPNGVLRESIGSPGGQWGVTQDDYGKIWIQAGASGLPGYFQLPLAYGNFTVPDQIDPGLRVPYGLTRLGDVQDGMPAVRKEDGAVIRTTAAAGNDVFRGDRLPADLRGDYLYGEVVSRIVRRVRARNEEGLTRLSNVYEAEKSEFIRSTDPLFRPVDLKTAPDGTLYIVDMYHGIIQEGQWTQPGSYLRAKIEQYRFDEVVGLGRIWRVTHEGMERSRTRPRMYQETAAQLVAHLRHPNGWWRDKAQQQLVLRQDRSVVPALRGMVRGDENVLARIHALWTLEGLGALDAAFAREALGDSSSVVRLQAIRASETLHKAGDRSFVTDYERLTKDPDVNVAIQAMLTLNTLKVPHAPAVIRSTMAARPARGVQEVGRQILTPPSTGGGPGGPLTEAQRARLATGGTVFREMCSECHGQNGMGMPVGDGQLIAPAIAGSTDIQGHPEYVIRTLLRGLTGPIRGRTYAGAIMVPQAEQSDEWIAAIASYVRTSLTNHGTLVTPEQVARSRAATASRATPYTYEELTAEVPMPLDPQPSWKALASHAAPTVIGGTPNPRGAFNFEGWTTGIPQQPGMWFQVELPAPVLLAGVQFNSPVVRVPVPASTPPTSAAPPPTAAAAPRGYHVQVSMDGTSWSEPVAAGTATGASTLISFEPVRARFLRITQTARTEDAPVWSMLRMRLYGQKGP